MKKLVTIVLCLVIISLSGIQNSSADTIIGGAFDGWNADPISAVSVAGDVATLQIQPFDANVTWISLSKDITLSQNVSSVSFDVKFIKGDSRELPPDFIGQPNFLQVSFVPMTGDPIYFSGYDQNGVYIINRDLTTTPVSSATTIDGWYTFTQDISSLAGLSGILAFDLFDRGDIFLDSAQVRNVYITETQMNPVPEPATLLLIGSGLLLLPLRRLKKRVKI